MLAPGATVAPHFQSSHQHHPGLAGIQSQHQRHRVQRRRLKTIVSYTQLILLLHLKQKAPSFFRWGFEGNSGGRPGNCGLFPVVSCCFYPLALQRIGTVPCAVKHPPEFTQVTAPTPTVGVAINVEAAAVVAVGTTVITPLATVTEAT